ncbi:Polyketide synthase enoylreductase [Penicillium verrucosum]|uniref:Polyketide synthase enoylreductase n=1 Tax=Penicillium verrucosum TaxID=60171 RepID=UPI0025454057|nr:Polyketide synthase enoylreductase [Penicillium verrucosum]KAJ5922476.1 Polyketide synthase enoylreductase [Penicillium verrucosum]
MDSGIRPFNQASWAISPKARSFVVQESPYNPPGPNEVLVKNSAVAINPIDFMVQDDAFLDYLQYPHILGCDVAGEIVEIGSEVKRFVVGQRIIGYGFPYLAAKSTADQIRGNFSHGFGLDSGKAKHGAFQNYTVCLATLSPPSTKPRSTGKTILIWGGASSVGSCAIQLARDSGYEVFTTASPHNHALCSAWGAAMVFDYQKESVIDEIIDALREKQVVGFFDAISKSYTIQACVDIIKRMQLNTKVITTNPIPGNVRLEGVVSEPVLGGDIAGNPVGKMLYEDYLPMALQQKTFKPCPDPLIIGHGLEAIQAGVDRVKQGVSSQKVVVTLGA